MNWLIWTAVFSGGELERSKALFCWVLIVLVPCIVGMLQSLSDKRIAVSQQQIQRACPMSPNTEHQFRNQTDTWVLAAFYTSNYWPIKCHESYSNAIIYQKHAFQDLGRDKLLSYQGEVQLSYIRQVVPGALIKSRTPSLLGMCLGPTKS